MISLNPHFKELLGYFHSEGVKYLILGGYAVNYYGYHRNTKDIDLWIVIDPDNAHRVSLALQKFGFSAASVPAANFLVKGRIHVFGREPFRVDVLTDPSGIDFESCYRRRVEVDMDGLQVPFISLEDLKANKKASGRAKDLADIEALPDQP